MLSLEDMAALAAAEEKRLGVNSPEFIRRHNEIMAMADEIQMPLQEKCSYQCSEHRQERVTRQH